MAFRFEFSPRLVHAPSEPAHPFGVLTADGPGIAADNVHGLGLKILPEPGRRQRA